MKPEDVLSQEAQIPLGQITELLSVWAIKLRGAKKWQLTVKGDLNRSIECGSEEECRERAPDFVRQIARQVQASAEEFEA